MRLETNFIKPAGSLAPYVAGISLTLSVVLIIACFLLWGDVSRLRNKQPELQARLAALRDKGKALPVQEIPRKQLQILRQRIQKINSLIGSAGTPLQKILPQLEKLIPDAVWLSSLQHRTREGETRIVIESTHSDFLTEFMDRLEKSHLFRQVLLTRKVQRNEGTHNTVQFEILLRE